MSAELHDLRERLAEKIPVLRQMADDHSSLTEDIRLRGKAEGVAMALSYVDEALRHPVAVPMGEPLPFGDAS